MAAPFHMPENFSIDILNATCITLSWAPPQYKNGPITEYQVNKELVIVTVKQIKKNVYNGI